ncbi:MAG TPA: hypothetical protein VHM89_09015 [Acidimicrobiales bacterium]|nr:hypothetical protein [Acidimicrobiales bacterium]
MIGSWVASPVGAFTDVFWASPTGERALLVGTDRVARFVSAVYGFDRVEVVTLHAHQAPASLDVEAGDLRVRLDAGPGWRIPLAVMRPPGITRWIEGPLARALLGVRTFGVSPSGVREWYVADEYRRVTAGRASIAGRDLGPLERRWAPAGFGFSEPPRLPAMVHIRPQLFDPSGDLDRLVA